MRAIELPAASVRRAMDVWESDAWALDIRRRANVDPDEVVRPSELARRLPGLAGVVQAKGLRLVKDGELQRGPEGWRIVVRAGIPLVRARFAVLHEIAEFAIGDAVDEHIDHACNAVAASLAMPRRPFGRALRAHGGDPHRLGEIFVVSSIAAALRIGEVTRIPVAVVTPRRVWTRGPEIAWPSGDELQRIARAGRPGPVQVARGHVRSTVLQALRAVPLEPRCVGFFVDDLDAIELLAGEKWLANRLKI